MATRKTISRQTVGDFQELVLSYYHEHARDLPWRDVDEEGLIDPYHVTVSEIMLQQTQVNRVIDKFTGFITHFPDRESLAKATLTEVLEEWSGLGYNRRAKYLHDFALLTSDKPFPMTLEELLAHKGIGKNTAAAILVYAYDQKQVFVETNIRTVMLHHFFGDAPKVSDKEILTVVKDTLPEGSWREWYWALMDYGSYLKNNGVSHLNRATAYKKQSAFKGSLRELRSTILRFLLDNGGATEGAIRGAVNDDRYTLALKGLQKDGLVDENGGHYTIC